MTAPGLNTSRIRSSQRGLLGLSEKTGSTFLQRRRERYIIIHTWKIANGLARNDIGMTFKDHARQGLRAMVPPWNNTAQRSMATHYENSLAVKAAIVYRTPCRRTPVQ